MAASTFSFYSSEASPEQLLKRKNIRYIFVCKTHKNEKIWSKFR